MLHAIVMIMDGEQQEATMLVKVAEIFNSRILELAGLVRNFLIDDSLIVLWLKINGWSQ